MADISGRPPRAKSLTLLILALFAAGVLGAGMLLLPVGGLGLIAKHYADKFENTKCNLHESTVPRKTTLVASDGHTRIATLFSQDRVPIPLSEVPDYLQDALIATEDRRFYSHHGVDMRGLIRSLVSTATGGDTQGGSTLTMQYVKQIRYYQAGDNKAKQEAAIAQNVNRKIEDAKCALYFEETKHESKSEILDNYLNIAFFGEHSYGIQTAAQTYFNKDAKDLSLVESALLVGLLRAPSAYDPFLHPEAAKERRNEVLQNLVAVGKLKQSVANKEMALPIALATHGPPRVHEGCANANSSVPNVAFFCEYAVNWLKNVDGLSNTLLQTGGLKIVTTLDPSLQTSMQRHLRKTIPAKSPMTAVLPAIDPKSGDVLAMATSKRFGTKGKGETEQPVFTSHTAQAASTFKLFPLLTALSVGVPDTWPIYTVGNTGSYKTQHCLTSSAAVNGDANETYPQLGTLKEATAQSSNTYFVALADWLLGCHLDPMVNLAKQLGLNSLDAPSEIPHQTEAQTVVNKQQAQRFVLGFLNASPLEMAGAYAAVADGGRFYPPAPILSVEENGQPLPVKRQSPKQVIAPQVADEATQLLIGDTQTTGTSAAAFQSWYAKNSSYVAGKTGTMVAVNRSGQATNKNAAVWFVGMTPNLVATSALINFTDSNAPSRGLPGEKPGAAYGDYASHVWLKTLQPSLVKQNWIWPDPLGVSGVPVPPVVNQDLATAKKTLSSAGFKMRQLDPSIQCASTVTAGNVAYYAPTIAPRGSTITVCPSLGVAQPAPPPPPPPPPTHHQTGGNGNGNGGSPPSGSPPSGSPPSGGSPGSGTPGGPGGGGQSGGPPSH